MSVRTKEVNCFVTTVCKPKVKKPDKGWPKKYQNMFDVIHGRTLFEKKHHKEGGAMFLKIRYVTSFCSFSRIFFRSKFENIFRLVLSI